MALIILAFSKVMSTSRIVSNVLTTSIAVWTIFWMQEWFCATPLILTIDTLLQLYTRIWDRLSRLHHTYTIIHPTFS